MKKALLLVTVFLLALFVFNTPAVRAQAGSMMGYGANSGVYGVVGGLTWVALIAFLVAGVYFFIKQAGKK